jgi:2-methylcitrate dehydratase PrpD
MKETNLDILCNFVATTAERALSPVLLDAAKQCLVDWFAVSLAALDDPAALIVRRQMQRWASNGRALNLYGDTGAAGPMALVNATLSHSLDFDDLHLGSAFHASGPTFAAVLAIGMDRGNSEADILNAFVTGFEIGATMGEDGIGVKLADQGWNPTGVLGHFSATAAAAALLGLSHEQTAHALGLAATQTAGLQASGGSMAKPFHVGKSALNGVMAAELAEAGMDATTSLLDHQDRGILGSLIQEPTLARFDTLGQIWQITRNSFKPYAACQLTHAAFEAGRKMMADFEPGGLSAVRIYVNPLAPKVANKLRPTTPLEGKFSIPYCVALGLNGYAADLADFTQARLAESALLDLSELVEVIPEHDVERWAARIELVYSDGAVRSGKIDAVRGSLGSPLSWADLDTKFLRTTAPVLGDNGPRMLDALHHFEESGRIAQVMRIIEESRAG